MIKVLVVEDSAVVLEYLLFILNSQPGIEVVGTARNGEEAIEAVKRIKPDVVTMDIHMPKMDGFEATRIIMETTPTPIIIVSGSLDVSEVATSFLALEAGALLAIPRPFGIRHPDHEATAREFVQAVKLMSEVKVVRRWSRRQRKLPSPTTPADLQQRPIANIQIVAIGASTGGPLVLQTILSALPAGFTAPVLIVQHMAAGFTQGFAEWLGQSCSLPIHIASNGESALPGHVYIAPEGAQIKIGIGGQITLTRDSAENGHCPSVSYFFRSVADVYGKNAVGVLLSGMGKDGAEELKLMKKKGATTIAQDEESSVVFGMPGEAVKIDAAQYVLNPEGISTILKELVGKKQ